MVEFILSIEKNVLKIRINDQLHLAIKRDELIGIQCYIDGNTNLYVIEYITKSSLIKSEYVNKEQWTSLCTQLDNKIEWV